MLHAHETTLRLLGRASIAHKIRVIVTIPFHRRKGTRWRLRPSSSRMGCRSDTSEPPGLEERTNAHAPLGQNAAFEREQTELTAASRRAPRGSNLPRTPAFHRGPYGSNAAESSDVRVSRPTTSIPFSVNPNTCSALGRLTASDQG
jgi:hypothetical protein